MTDAQVAAIASSLTIFATIAQGVYARRKGRKRDPVLARIEKKVDDLKEHFDLRHDLLSSRVEMVERIQRPSQPGRVRDDHHKDDS